MMFSLLLEFWFSVQRQGSHRLLEKFVPGCGKQMCNIRQLHMEVFANNLKGKYFLIRTRIYIGYESLPCIQCRHKHRRLWALHGTMLETR